MAGGSSGGGGEGITGRESDIGGERRGKGEGNVRGGVYIGGVVREGGRWSWGAEGFPWAMGKLKNWEGYVGWGLQVRREENEGSVRKRVRWGM